MNSFIGTKEAAKRLHVSVRRIQALISAGRLPAEKIGNSFAIKESDLTLLNGRKNGRPVPTSQPSREEWLKLVNKYAGCIDGLPNDLSTNPKYLEGLGRKKNSDYRR